MKEKEVEKKHRIKIKEIRKLTGEIIEDRSEYYSSIYNAERRLFELTDVEERKGFERSVKLIKLKT